MPFQVSAFSFLPVLHPIEDVRTKRPSGYIGICEIAHFNFKCHFISELSKDSGKSEPSCLGERNPSPRLKKTHVCWGKERIHLGFDAIFEPC